MADPADGFDQTVDVDTVPAFIQMAFLAFSGYLLLNLRCQHHAAASRTDSHAALPEPS